MARALEAALVSKRQVAAVGRAGHGRILRRPGDSTAEMRAFPVQGEEAFRHTGDVELAFADLLHIADFEVVDQPGDDRTAKSTQPLGGKEADKANAPLAEQHQHRAPAQPAEHHPPTNPSALLTLDLFQLA